jgi:tetratricopeptide (TPR) repeat protein
MRSGEREYAYLEKMLKLRTEGILYSIHCMQIDWEALSIDPTALNPMLLQAAESERDSERKFLLFLTLAVQCGKTDEYAKIVQYAQKALEIKPDDMVTNFILAEAQERLGSGEKAVKSYETALQDPAAQSPPLKEFIMAQVNRVRTEGPRKGAKIHGLRYMTW